MPRPLTLVLPLALLLAACGDHAPPVPREAPRPVEVYALSHVDPNGPLEITGSVSSWKEQDVAFEVSGRLQFIQEPGTPLEGRWEEGGEVHLEGDLLARLDDQPYRISVSAFEASVAVAEANVQVAQAQLEEVLPANLRAARAQQDFAQAEYERYKQAGETSAVSNTDVLRAKASRDVAVANVEQGEAAGISMEAELNASRASLARSEQSLQQAQWEAERCRLYAPFSGEVSDVFVEAGGFVQPGQKVAHLVMMDPIQVDVALSAESLRELKRYSMVRISVPGVDQPITGRVYDLGTVADPQTRTFRASIIVRNVQSSDLLAGSPQARLPRFGRAMTPLRHDPMASEGTFFVESRRSLKQDAEGWFVFASIDPQKASEIDLENPVVTVTKVRVTPGERLVNYQGIYVLRELTDAGGLTADTLLPLDLPDDFPDGGQLLLQDAGWVLRPGQVVSVLMEDRETTPGLYVPMQSVLPDGPDFGHVFVVQDGKARSIRVALGDRVGPLVRLEAADPEQSDMISVGAQVVRQAHFLHDGEAVRVIRSDEVRP